MADLEHISAEDLRRRQLSFSKSRHRSRVHRLTYPDYIEVKVFDDAGTLVGQHRFIGLYTSSVYTMNPKLIPILRRKVERVMEMSSHDSSDHESRELRASLRAHCGARPLGREQPRLGMDERVPAPDPEESRARSIRLHSAQSGPHPQIDDIRW